MNGPSPISLGADLISALPVGVLELGCGRVKSANDEAVRVFGMPPERLTTESADALAALVVQESGEPWPSDTNPLIRALHGRDVATPVTVGVRQPEGGIRWAVANLVRPTAGGDSAWLCLGDITARVESERCLRESESRIRALVEGAFEGIAISVDGTIVEANEALARMMGYPLGELVGLTAARLVAPEAHELVQRSANTQHLTPVLLTVRRRDGSTFPAEVLGRNATYLGRPARVVGVRDLTERERAASALRRWEHIFQHAPWGVAVTAPDGMTIDLANRGLSAKLGYEVQDLVGRAVLDLFVPEDRQEVRRRLDGLDAEPRQQFEAHMISSLGPPLPVSIDAAAVTTSDGRLLYRSLHVLDISARKAQEEDRRQLEEQIRHAQKLESLGVLAGGIAHDFNNLLMAVMGYADLALKYLAPSSPAVEFIELVQRSSRRAADLANQMLAYAGRARVEVGTLHVNDVISEMMDLLKVSMSKKVRLHLDLSPSCPPIDGDAAQIRQVIMNLVTNASEALGEGTGDIHVSTSYGRDDNAGWSLYLGEQLKEDAHVVLEVRDNGSGMDIETRRKLFEPFFTTKFTGRGLGLAAVFGIVRSHRGAIAVSTERGRGSSFRVFFPTSTRAPLIVPRPQAPSWTGQGLVLLADDEEMVRRLHERVLADAGFDVIAVSDGRRAVEAFRERQNEISLAILDVTMPELSGTQVLELIRRTRPALPVILISGYQETDITGRLDAADPRLVFLHKPYSIQSLIDRARQLVTASEQASQPRS